MESKINNTLTRKLKIVVIEEDSAKRNEIYRLIRNEQYQQYRALNLGMSLLYTHNQLEGVGSGAEHKIGSKLAKVDNNIKKANDELQKAKSARKINKDKIEKINNNIEEYKNEKVRLKEEFDNKMNSRILEDKEFKKKYIDELYTVLQSQVNFNNKDNMSLVIKRVKVDFKTILENGLARGDRSLTNYKRDFPLMVRGRDLTFYKDNDEFFIKWIKGIKFKVLVGRNDKDRDKLIYTLNKVVYFQSMPSEIEVGVNEKGKAKTKDNPLKDYKVCDSSISLNDNKLILNLVLGVKTEKETGLVKGRVVGVDLGIKIPAYVSLSDKHYVKKAIGSFESFMKVNAQMKATRRRVNKQVSKAKAGKGRDKKLKALRALKNKQSNYNTTYNHYLSKEIVKFAVDNKASQINVEFLTGENFKKNKLLADWSYYQLQEMIEYKAKKVGIIVKKVDPYRTSQTCSICENYEEGQRENQEEFICKVCKRNLNADYNASRNIAMSDKYVSDIKDTQYYKLRNQKEIDS